MCNLMSGNNINLVKKLSQDEIVEIYKLEKSYQETKNRYFKLDPQAFLAEDETTVHILYYEKNKLTAYMLLSSFDEKELECSTIVSENEKVFSGMCHLAIQNAKERNIGKLLIIIDKNDSFLIQQMQNLKFNYSFAEHRMIFNETKFIQNNNYNAPGYSNIIVRDAISIDEKAIDLLYNQNFRASSDDFTPEPLPEMDMRYVKVATMGDEVIATIKVEYCNGVVGLYGFVLDKKLRGRGFGRQILKIVIEEILKTSFQKLYLEVDTENIVAMALYESLGFEHQVTFNYYDYLL